MRIDIFRRRFPEYGDMTDIQLEQVARQMLTDLTDDPLPEHTDTVNVPGVEMAVNDLAGLLVSANNLLAQINKTLNKPEKPEPPEKEQVDTSPYFMALGVQLQNVEAAIKAIKLPEMPKMQPMPKMEPMPLCKGFKIQRDEIGNIDRVIPEYDK
jgi:hypothetical protein